MLDSQDHEAAAEAQHQHRAEASEDAHRRAHQGSLAEAPEGDAEAQVRHASEEDPYFPTLEDATEANKAALAGFGQTNHALLRPDVLEGALGRAANYWYYENSMPKAAAALAHGVGQAQAFEDGNKRTAYWLTHHFLRENGIGHLMPDDDSELADHLVGYGKGTHTMDDTAKMFEEREQFNHPNPARTIYAPDPPEHLGHIANILDPIHDTLDPRVWDNPGNPQPTLKPEHANWIVSTIFRILEDAGYDNPHKWATIVLTGSLTTYQYSDESDCDVSLFVDTQVFPDWSRAEMIGLMISSFDETKLPGTPHTMQCFVVAKELSPTDLYKPGLRSGYAIFGANAGQWLVPPERDRVHDVEREQNLDYTVGLEAADKMEKLLRYEPDKAIMYWHQIHKRRMRDQKAGKGDYSQSNVVYKMLANRGLFPQISEVSGEHIARLGAYEDDPRNPGRRRWRPEYDWKSDRERYENDPGAKGQDDFMTLVSLLQKGLANALREGKNPFDQATLMEVGKSVGWHMPLDWEGRDEHGQGTSEGVSSFKRAYMVALQSLTGQGEGSPDIFQGTDNPRKLNYDEMKETHPWAPSLEDERTKPHLMNNPHALGLDQQPRALTRLDNPEGMEFQEMPEGLGDKIPGWGGHIETPKGRGPLSQFFCKPCNRNFRVNSWDDVRNSENPDWETEVTCPTCQQPARGPWNQPQFWQYPRLDSDPRNPGMMRENSTKMSEEVYSSPMKRASWLGDDPSKPTLFWSGQAQDQHSVPEEVHIKNFSGDQSIGSDPEQRVVYHDPQSNYHFPKADGSGYYDGVMPSPEAQQHIQRALQTVADNAENHRNLMLQMNMLDKAQENERTQRSVDEMADSLDNDEDGNPPPFFA